MNYSRDELSMMKGARNFRREASRYGRSILTSLVTFGVLLGIFSSACATATTRSAAATRASYLREHAAIDPRVAAAIEEGVVRFGMDRDQVVAAVGRPVVRNRYEAGRIETWILRATSFHQAGVPQNASLVRLAFVDGVLVQMTTH
ncbi:MAG: hypothetical protein NDJ92_10770 [Thermoanaerobaculia bacterium]|nr:hypothetical protein [Thermoanaerobaculia bacterium]